jgi:hypothetical protein
MITSVQARQRLRTGQEQPLEQHRPIRRRITRVLYAAVTAGIALTTVGLAGAEAPAMASAESLGPPVYTAGWAGYTAHGRWFRFVSATVTVPQRQIPRSDGGAMYLMLEGRGSPAPAQIYAEAGGGAGSVGWNLGTFKVSPHVGDQLAISIYYDQHGHDYYTATDLTQHTTQTIRADVPKMTYTTAMLFGVVYPTTTPPSADTRLWKVTDSHLTTYTGRHGTIVGPWTTSKMIVTSDSTSSGTVVASPSGLHHNSQNFGVWLRH